MAYRIRDWNNIYENNRTRELKRLDWVPVPNRMDGDGYTELLDHPDGASHLGAWLAILQIASRCDPRGTLLREGGRPHDIHSLSRISRVPVAVFEAAIPRLLEIDWIELTSAEESSGLHEAARKSQEGAGKPQEGAASRARVEGKGMEGKGTQNPSAADAAAEPADAAFSLIEMPAPPEEVSDRWIQTQHDDWYSTVYWNRKNREDSRKAFRKRLRLLMHGGMTAPAAVAFLREQAIADQRRFETTPDWDWRQNLHPATWLNGERWLDQPRARDSPQSRRLTPTEVALQRAREEERNAARTQ